jgi:uncharacterized membrane protein
VCIFIYVYIYLLDIYLYIYKYIFINIYIRIGVDDEVSAKMSDQFMSSSIDIILQERSKEVCEHIYTYIYIYMYIYIYPIRKI